MRRLKRRGLSGEDLRFLGVRTAFLDRVRFRSGNLKLSDEGFFLTVVQWVVLKAEFWPWRLMHGYGERSLVSDFGFSAVWMMIVVDSGGDYMGSPFPVGGYGSIGGDGCCWRLFNGSDMTKSSGFFGVNISLVISAWTRDVSVTSVTIGWWSLTFFRVMMENRIETDALLLAAILPNQVLLETVFGVWRFPPPFVYFRFSCCGESSGLLVVFRCCSGVCPDVTFVC